MFVEFPAEAKDTFLWREKSSPWIPVPWEGCVGGERHRWAGICSSLSCFLNLTSVFSLSGLSCGFGFSDLHAHLELQEGELSK